MRRALVGGAAQSSPSLSLAVCGWEEAVEHAKLGTLEESAAGDEDPQEGTIMASDEAWRSVVG
jgi:hypothetical protein